MCRSVGAPRAWSEGLACGCWMSHSGRIAVGSGGWSEGLLGGHQLGTLTGWPVSEGHGPEVSQNGAHQGCANEVAVNGRGVGRLNPCKHHTSATLVGLLDLLWACLCGGGSCEATSVMCRAGVCTLTLLWYTLSTCRGNVNNVTHQYLWYQRVLAASLLFGKCFRFKTWFPSLTVWLPFKLQLFFCAPGQANLCAGASVMSLPTAGLCWVWGPLHYCLHLFCSLLCDHFIPHCAKGIHSGFSSSSGGIVLCVGVDSVGTWEEVCSGSFYAASLNPPLPYRCIFKH